jgi:hypothetical protein
MKDRYALFFDIDGTLVSFKTHEIPASTIFALTQAKANGHQVFIATGRPPMIITNLGAIAHLIDGYITTNGAYCYVGDEVVCCNPIAPDDVKTVLADADEHDYSCIIASEHHFVVYNPHEDVERIFVHDLDVQNLDPHAPWQPALGERIMQFSPFFAPAHEPRLMARIPNCVSGRWHHEFTDITARGADKGNALRLMARHLGLDAAHTIAFGDGGNDATLIRQAGTGIAMGNAIDALKQDADRITATVDEDGILLALRQLGIV